MQKYNKFIRLYIVICMLVTITIIYLFEIMRNFNNLDFGVIVTFFLIGFLSIYNIASSQTLEFSLYKINGYFFLIFLFLAPLYQYARDIFPWGLKVGDQDLLFVNFLIIVWLLVYIAVYWTVKPSQKKGANLPVNNTMVVAGFIITFISAIFIFAYSGGFTGMFNRTSSIEINQSLDLILTRSLRPFPVLFLAFLYFLIYKKGVKGILYKYLFIVTFLLVILTNFPTAVSRYHAAAVYIGLLILFFKDKIKFDYLFVLGIIVIFPMLESFRYSKGNIFEALNFETINLATGHFDAYSMLVRTVEYVILNESTNGYQLLGSIFFFIPRSIWPTKPMGSGWTVGEYFNLPFLNISSPIIAEAIINFGLFLFIIMAVILAIFNKKLDSLYWVSSNEIRYIDIYFIFLIGLYFFILRGDLLSSMAFSVGFFIPMISLYLLTRLHFKKKKI